MPMLATRKNRMKMAGRAMDHLAKEFWSVKDYEALHPDDKPPAIVDMLSYLMLFAHEEGFGTENMTDLAFRHFEDELRSEQ